MLKIIKNNTMIQLQTSCSRLCQQFLYNNVVSSFIGNTRILNQLFLVSNTDVVFSQKIFQFFESLLVQKNWSIFYKDLLSLFLYIYLYSVVAFLVDNGNITPVHSFHNFNHRFHLVMVRWYGPRKVLETLFITQFWTG